MTAGHIDWNPFARRWVVRTLHTQQWLKASIREFFHCIYYLHSHFPIVGCNGLRNTVVDSLDVHVQVFSELNTTTRSVCFTALHPLYSLVSPNGEWIACQYALVISFVITTHYLTAWHFMHHALQPQTSSNMTCKIYAIRRNDVTRYY